ncbi:MAG: TrkH family potassium uptake protein [Alphaproteobacteria bacterium]|nr:TrkH family potassium uptake protein [Alphaproteobacteria bacterium]
MIDFKPVFLVVGIFLATLAILMCIPAAVDKFAGHHDWQVFLASAAVTFLTGLMLIFGNRTSVRKVSMRQAFLLTTATWISAAAFGALPFAFSEMHMSYTDAVFESMSGLTTTGATVIVGLDNAPPGILLWRALLHGLGGIGIVVMAVAVLPMLRIGGMQIFRMESSDKSDKVLPKTAQMASAILIVYLVLIVLTVFALWGAGMSLFDSICHGIAAVSTGGFSTKDASIGHYDNALFDGILVVSMISGALPLTWYVRVAQRGKKALWLDSQVVTFFQVLLVCIGVMAAWLWVVKGMTPPHAFRMAAFNVTSIITDTGFVNTDYGLWGDFAVASFIFYTFIGGCTGSTAGSIKIFRWQILFRAVSRQLSWMFQPHRVMDLRYNGQSYTDDVVSSVISFVAIYLISFALMTLVVSLLGVDFLTSASAVSAALAASGPGLGPIVGPAGTYQPLPDSVTWVLTFAMLFGRLELFTILVLFTPQFWRD